MDPIVEQAQMTNSNNSILVQFHPSANGDIFYEPEMAKRLNFYQSIGLPFLGYPSCYVDGLKEPPWVYSISNITSEINNRLAIETPISIMTELSQTPAKTSNTNSIINYRTMVSSEEVIDSNNLRLLAFITESNIDHSAPNGLKIHNHIVLDIIPDENGIPLDFSDSNNLSQIFEGSVDVNITDNLENHSIVAIVQDFATGEVHQAIEITYDQYLDTEDDLYVLPSEFSLKNAYPNPFNPTTNISFTVGNESPISIQVFNIIGKTNR